MKEFSGSSEKSINRRMWHLPQCARPTHSASAQYVVSGLIVMLIIVAEKYILRVVSDMAYVKFSVHII